MPFQRSFQRQVGQIIERRLRVLGPDRNDEPVGPGARHRRGTRRLDRNGRLIPPGEHRHRIGIDVAQQPGPRRQPRLPPLAERRADPRCAIGIALAEVARAVDQVDVALVFLVQPLKKEAHHLDVMLAVERVCQVGLVNQHPAVQRRPDRHGFRNAVRHDAPRFQRVAVPDSELPGQLAHLGPGFGERGTVGRDAFGLEQLLVIPHRIDPGGHRQAIGHALELARRQQPGRPGLQRNLRIFHHVVRRHEGTLRAQRHRAVPQHRNIGRRTCGDRTDQRLGELGVLTQTANRGGRAQSGAFAEAVQQASMDLAEPTRPARQP